MQAGAPGVEIDGLRQVRKRGLRIAKRKVEPSLYHPRKQGVAGGVLGIERRDLVEIRHGTRGLVHVDQAKAAPEKGAGGWRELDGLFIIGDSQIALIVGAQQVGTRLACWCKIRRQGDRLREINGGCFHVAFGAQCQSPKGQHCRVPARRSAGVCFKNARTRCNSRIGFFRRRCFGSAGGKICIQIFALVLGEGCATGQHQRGQQRAQSDGHFPRPRSWERHVFSSLVIAWATQ
ncbi:MAG TPA: hypothetical protein VKF35_10530 [Hyphomicrobiaceae bacterium]|nr:hypothetical protein [Hyphomicrobiaceae bacterium]